MTKPAKITHSSHTSRLCGKYRSALKRKKHEAVSQNAIISMKDMTKAAKNAADNSGYSKVKQRP